MIEKSNLTPVKNPQKPVIGSGVPNIPALKRETKRKLGMKNKKLLSVLLIILFIIIAIIAVLIAWKQRLDRTAVAPTAPVSEPAAYRREALCSLSFDIGPGITITVSPSPTGTLTTPTPTESPSPTPTPPPGSPTPTPTPAPSECGYTPCSDDNDCNDNLICVTSQADGNNYCSDPLYEDTCIESADENQGNSVEVCCTAPTATPTPTEGPSPTPTPTPAPSECGYTPCSDDNDCNDDLICVTSQADGNNYCSMTSYQDRCETYANEDLNNAYAVCCTAPTPTVTGVVYHSPTPTPTLPPGVTPNPTVPYETVTYTIITSVQCNDTCTNNADCANISHICYNGRCRLDENPEDEYCRLPSGEIEKIVEESYVTERIQPEIPEELYESGFDWIKTLKVGLGFLGAAALIILFL